jgi:DNA-binding MarR family transcriptional regulator
MSRRLTTILHTEGYSLDAWRVITLLSDGTGHHMTEIAAYAFLPPGTLTKLIDHLVDDNLIHRQVDDIDRRRIRALLTVRGRRFHQRVSEQVEASMAALPTAGADREYLEQLLIRLIDDLDGSPADTTHTARGQRLETV